MDPGIWALDPGIGHASAVALFVLAVAILVWPMTRRLLRARRERAHLTRVASGLDEEH